MVDGTVWCVNWLPGSGLSRGVAAVWAIWPAVHAVQGVSGCSLGGLRVQGPREGRARLFGQAGGWACANDGGFHRAHDALRYILVFAGTDLFYMSV